jgi:hypothetical protein
LQGRAPATLDEKYLVSENSPLSNVSGQNSLKQYLDDYQLIYQTEDVLDVDLLLDEVVQGSVPSLDHEGAYPASAVHERALGNPRLKLFLDEAPIRSAMIKAVEQGKLVVRHPNGDVYDHQGCVSGSPGNRTRSENQKLRGLRLESDVLVAPVSASCVAEWLKTDDPEPLPPDAPIPVEQAAAIKFVTEETVQQAIAEGTIDYEVHDGQQVIVYNEKFQNWQSLLPEPDQITTGDWEEAIAAARKRPLQALKLTARKPDVARKLIGLAQPFGATTLTISVNVGGALKDGGTVRFKADKLKHNHALKPLDMAASMYRAMGQQVNYEAVLELSFAGEGVTGLSTAFERACEDAGSEVLLNAEFGKEV